MPDICSVGPKILIIFTYTCISTTIRTSTSTTTTIPPFQGRFPLDGIYGSPERRFEIHPCSASIYSSPLECEVGAFLLLRILLKTTVGLEYLFIHLFIHDTGNEETLAKFKSDNCQLACRVYTCVTTTINGDWYGQCFHESIYKFSKTASYKVNFKC